MSAKSRSVRVFLSSTFRDFSEERDLLVRKVFPELRRRARERSVEVIDIDLRWGITPEQAERGEVLPICLAEIDRARPFFFGFIGERYGWVPEATQYDLSLLVEQPWLDEYRGGKSVTELEMLHGVLNNPAMAGRAFFYFRDTQYSQAKGGAYLSESEGHHAKLELLKNRIRESGFPVMEDYPSPEALAARVQEDLWRVIDEAFPVESVPDPVALERRKHEVYGGARLGLYLGGEKYFKALGEAMEADPFKTVLITGPSGGGKSALVANWVERYATAHPDAWVITHYLGSSADAADPVRMVYRIEREIARVTGEEDKLEGDSNKILQQFSKWLSRASAFSETSGREWIIVLDGLDKLTARTELNWWPSALPSKVKVVASCLDGEIQSALKARVKPFEVVVAPLSAQGGCELIRTYLARFNKVLPEPHVGRIVAHPLGGSPLFLRTVAEEMRVFGVHEELQQRLGGYLESQSMSELFAKVFDRVEEDNRREDMEAALSVLWGALESFAEDELIALTGLAPVVWSSILNALEGSLISNGGRIAFGHDYLRKAVENRYVASSQKQSIVQRKLSDFCSDRMRHEGRKANSSYVRRQSVRHFIISEQWDEAVAALSDLEFIEARAKAKEVNEMLGDYALAIGALPEMKRAAIRQQDRKESMKQWVTEITKYSALCTQQRVAGGEKPALQSPPEAIRLKSNEEIAQQSQRIVQEPNREDTLTAFFRFVATQKNALEGFSGHPAFVAQQACNHAPAGPVHNGGLLLLLASSSPRMTRNWNHEDEYNPMHPCIMILEGDEMTVNAVALSPDGAKAVTAGMSNKLRVWSLDAGICVHVLEGHSESVASVAVSTDGLVALSASYDNTLRVWDLTSGTCSGVLEGHSNWVESVALSSDARLVVSGSYDRTIRVWDLGAGSCVHVLKGHSDSVTAVAVSLDGEYAVSGCQDHTIRVWDLASGMCTKVLKGHSAGVRSIAISADSLFVVSGSEDQTLRLWDLTSGKCVKVLNGHSDHVCSVAISADGSLAVSASSDKTVRVWDLSAGSCARIFKSHTSSATSVAMSPDASSAVSGGYDATLRVWDMSLGYGSKRSTTAHEDVDKIIISQCLKFAVSADSAGNMFVLELPSGRCTRALEVHSPMVESLSISPDHSIVVSSGNDGTLRTFDLASGNCIRILAGHSAEVYSAAFTPDANRIISTSWDNTLRVWDVATGFCVNVLEGHVAAVSDVAISPDGSLAISASDDHTLRVWDLNTGRAIRIFEGHSNVVRSVEVSPNGSFAVSGSWDDTLRIWDLTSGTCIRILTGHSKAAISPDGAFIISAGSDKTVRIWDVFSGECLAILALEGTKGYTIAQQVIAVGFASGEVGLYRLENLSFGPRITTSFHNSTARAVCCGQLVDIPGSVTARINYWSDHPDEHGYTDPELLMLCPKCQASLRLNPFFATSRAR